MNEPLCPLCGESLLVGQIAHEVVGWEHDREQGGTNHIALRQRTGRVAHLLCVKLEAKGVAANQGSLL